MNCPDCSAENRDGAKFCNKCGRTLDVEASEPPPSPSETACPACKAPRTDAAKFCGECGYNFGDAASKSEQVGAMPTEAKPTIVATKVAGSNNTVIIIIIVALLAVIGAAAAGWYLFGQNKSGAASASATASMQTGPSDKNSMPQVDANGMPVKPAGAPGQAEAGSGQPPVAPGMTGQPEANEPPAGAAQPQNVMPEPMPQEARKRRAQVENPAPRRVVPSTRSSIDDQYQQRAGAECPTGGTGFFCREKLRYQLCNGHWSPSPGPGHSICRQGN